MSVQEKKDLLVMKFLHYFITKKNYNPVVVHGIQNEIWLENLNSDIKLVRLVLGYVHNKEQLEFDLFKTKRLTKQIGFKTFSFNMKVMTFYLDINEDVKLESLNNYFFVNSNKETLLIKDSMLKKYFPDMVDNLKFTEEGSRLFEKINNDILKKNMEESEKINELFTPKKPVITYFLIGIISILFILMYIFGSGSEDIKTLYMFGALVKDTNIIRLVSSIFLHIGILHLVMNVWALKLLGEQTEKFYGHIKMLIIFLYSGVIGNLLSIILMSDNTISAGASGAIFGLMGAVLYFSLNQRTYMAEALRKEILPVIIINIVLGFMISGINMYAHIGGLIGGMLISNALGIKYRTSRFEKINGIICSLVLVVILTYVAYFI